MQKLQRNEQRALQIVSNTHRKFQLAPVQLSPPPPQTIQQLQIVQETTDECEGTNGEVNKSGDEG